MFVARVLLNRCPPGRATSRISITTITGLENSPPKMPAMPARVLTSDSSLHSPRRRAIQPPTPPPMEASTFSGPTLAPPIRDTAETAMVPGTSRGSMRPARTSSKKPGTSSGRRVSRRSRPTTMPAPAVTATHHQCPPNQPGIGIGVPPRPELDHPQANQSCERAEHPEDSGVTNEHPEVAPLGKRRIGARFGRLAHKRNASKEHAQLTYAPIVRVTPSHEDTGHFVMVRPTSRPRVDVLKRRHRCRSPATESSIPTRSTARTVWWCWYSALLRERTRWTRWKTGRQAQLPAILVSH